MIIAPCAIGGGSRRESGLKDLNGCARVSIRMIPLPPDFKEFLRLLNANGINEIDGVSFQECYRRRRVADLDGLKINFIALPQLLKNKRASRRLKDLADVEALEPGRKGNKRQGQP